MMDKNKEKIKSLVKELGIINIDPDSVSEDFEEDIINALLAVKNYNIDFDKCREHADKCHKYFAEHPEASVYPYGD
jgi:transcription antitermination factor NusA-like protein